MTYLRRTPLSLKDLKLLGFALEKKIQIFIQIKFKPKPKSKTFELVEVWAPRLLAAQCNKHHCFDLGLAPRPALKKNDQISSLKDLKLLGFTLEEQIQIFKQIKCKPKPKSKTFELVEVWSPRLLVAQ